MVEHKVGNGVERIEILISRKKMVIAIILSLVFVLIGLFLLLHHRQFAPSGYILLVAILAIVFFGACAVIGIIRLFIKRHNRIGLTIAEQGIIDHLSFGFIGWSDMIAINIMSTSTTQFICIHVHNPSHYLQHKNAVQRYLLTKSEQMYGTPITIAASSSLKYDMKQLQKLLENGLRHYRETV
ncbi:hypothetical protein GCM10023211_07180 [Orbus sasakiae]|uniref:Transmembrane protein n=1 Tax=Orbus sasakiae TaxID=1078475 RepID=A0ABP9N190_9GAMM